MQPASIKPDLERFIEQQIHTGSFSSREAVIEAALRGMMNEQEENTLTPEDLAAIEEAEGQIDRGEFVDFGQFASATRKKYLNP